MTAGCPGLLLSGETKHSWDVLSLYFCRNGGGRADGRCLRKLFIFNPVESFGLFLVFGL